jgi:hypothetical protein
MAVWLLLGRHFPFLGINRPETFTPYRELAYRLKEKIYPGFATESSLVELNMHIFAQSNMKPLAELDITIRELREDTYSVEMRSALPESDTINTTSGEAHFNINEFRALCFEPEKYARLLTDGLLQDPNLRTAFSDARATAELRELVLQVRLRIEPGAERLHGLRWETLLDPRQNQGDNYLFTGDQVLFSRYLPSRDWKPVKGRPRRSLTALVLIASPGNLDQYPGLAPVDIKGELQRAREAMHGVRNIADLASPGQATLKNLAVRLDSKPVDVLYLVCHGTLKDDESFLMLEDEQGNAVHVPGEALVACLRDLKRRPRLVVLASCKGAGTGDDPHGTLAALGPRLMMAAGVPAVVGMQGSVSMNTASQFMARFFKELLKSGQIDLAAAVGRSAVRGEADFWMPVLFMRLKSGRVWSAASIAGKVLISAPLRGPLWQALRSPVFLVVFLATLLTGNWMSNTRLVRPSAHWYGDVLSRTKTPELAKLTRIVRIETPDLNCVFGGGKATGPALIRAVEALAASAPEMILIDIDTSDKQSFPETVELPNFGRVKVIWAVNADWAESDHAHTRTLESEGFLGAKDRENLPHGIGRMPEDSDGLLRGWQRTFNVNGREERSLPQVAREEYCKVRQCNSPREPFFARDYLFLPKMNIREFVPAAARLASNPQINQTDCSADVTTPDLRLTGKIVILGGFHLGSDWHYTPWGTKFGTELVASAIEEDLRLEPTAYLPRFLRWLLEILKWLVKIAIGLGIVALHHYFRPIWATVLTVLLLPIAIFISGWVIFAWGEYDLAVIPLVVGILIEQLVSSVRKADHFVELAEQYA